uniref:Uncharacterized protein n=1 Tax=Oryza glumipatula TaxID=40148 RepID=A0A0D9ZJY7_9ORYZ
MEIVRSHRPAGRGETGRDHGNAEQEEIRAVPALPRFLLPSPSRKGRRAATTLPPTAAGQDGGCRKEAAAVADSHIRGSAAGSQIRHRRHHRLCSVALWGKTGGLCVTYRGRTTLPSSICVFSLGLRSGHLASARDGGYLTDAYRCNIGSSRHQHALPGHDIAKLRKPATVRGKVACNAVGIGGDEE